MSFRFLGHFIRQRAAAGFTHVFAELIHDRTHPLAGRIPPGEWFGHHRHGRKRSSCSSQACEFEHAAPGKSCPAVPWWPIFASLISPPLPSLRTLLWLQLGQRELHFVLGRNELSLGATLEALSIPAVRNR